MRNSTRKPAPRRRACAQALARKRVRFAFPNDFKPAEKFVTSSTGNGYEGFIAWDTKNLYIGMAGNDIGAGASATKWVLVYLDGGASSTTTGQAYGGQQPTLPFGTSFHVGLKTDLSYTNKQTWDGGA